MDSTEFEAYNKGAIYSRMTGVYYSLPKTLVLCTFPRLFTPHCTNELIAADNIYREYKDYNINLVFASTDSPEVAEQYFSDKPVGFPFVRLNRKIEYDLGAIDRFGDACRATYFIKEGKIFDCDVAPFDSERDFWNILQKAKQVLL